MKQTTTRKKTLQKKKRLKIHFPFLFTFCALFLTWLLLSGRFDLFHIVLGLLSCLLVAFFSWDLLFSSLDQKGILTQGPRFVLYIPWLLYQVFLANIYVMYLVFHPRMKEIIDPNIVKFRSHLKSELALTTFANSITLTPGTITIYTTDFGDFEVHAIDRKSAEALPGEMEKRIAKIFDE